MSETRAHKEVDISGNSALTQENSIFMVASSWGLFGRLIFAHAGTLFLSAGIICFFAYNWEDLPAFAKFGIIVTGMAATAIFSLLRELNSSSSRLSLLLCGILGGVLMAVYGQVYQTGANAWELFRSWAIFLIPLAILGRQVGLWFMLWLISTLWGIFYLGQRTNVLHDGGLQANIVLYQCLAQTSFFLVWEAAAHFFSGPRFPFLQARWLPRTVGLSLLAFLTCALALHILEKHEVFGHPVVYTCIYLALVGGGAFYYRLRRMDLFMLASGLFSLIILLLTFVSRKPWHWNETSLLFVMVVILLAGSAVSGKLLMAHYRKWKNSVRERQKKADTHAKITGDKPDTTTRLRPFLLSGYSVAAWHFALQGTLRDEDPSEITDAKLDEPDPTQQHTPWPARLLMSICAWIAIPCIIALIFIIFASASFNSLEYSVLFLVLLGSGIALSRLRGTFFEQAALCLCLTGSIAASVLIATETNSRQLCLLPAIIIFAVSAPPTKNNAYRFLATTFAATLICLEADILFFPLEWLPYETSATVWESTSFTLVILFILFALIYSACSIALIYFWEKRTKKSRFILQHHPFLTALFAIPFLLGIFYVLLHSSKIVHFLAKALATSGLSIQAAGIGTAVSLGYLVFQLTKHLGRSTPRIIMMLLCILVVVVSWYLPWFGMGLLMLAMSRQAKSFVLFGTATLFLATCTVQEYYSLSTTLLAKSLSLGGIGLTLLLVATGLHQYLKWHLQKGSQHTPSSPMPLAQTQTQTGHTESDAETIASFRQADKPARAILAGCILIFFLFFSYSVHQKEQLLESGERVILALAPVDPRSLMQGDYMILSLEIENAIRQALRTKTSQENEPDKYLKDVIIAAPDENGIFRFIRFNDGTPLQNAEVRLIYRGEKRGNVRVGSGSFFFQEGYGRIFESARFAEFRVNKNGETLTTHLLDENRQRINPKQHPAKKPA